MSDPRASPDWRRALMADYFAGVPGRVIAKRYGVHKNFAYNFARRRGVIAPQRVKEATMWERAERT